MAMTPKHDNFVVLGRITGVSGLRGGVKIHSYTRPRAQIFSYDPWYVRQHGHCAEYHARSMDQGGKALVAEISGITDRDAAQALAGAEIGVRREQLPEPAPGEFYQTDLIGMEVRDASATCLGRVQEIRETGANDVLLVVGQTTLLVPLVMGHIVRHIDLDNGVIEVDWNPEYL